MSYKRNIVDEAKYFRRQGHSLSEIALKFNISKSTASLWTSKEKLTKTGSNRIKIRQDMARNKAFATIEHKKELLKQEIYKRSKQSLNKIKLGPELYKLLASIFIWTEGEKGSFSRLGFSNSDPAMVSSFLFLLRRSFPLDESKFRALVHIHHYHNRKEIINFWSKITKIPPRQFTKSYLKPHTGKRIRKNYMGSIHINYYDYRVARELASVYNMFASNLRGVG